MKSLDVDADHVLALKKEERIKAVKGIVSTESRSCLSRKGYLLIKDVPTCSMLEHERISFLFEIAKLLGEPVKQNASGDLIVRIQNEGSDYTSRDVRGHKTNASLNFHSDRADIIILLYARKAKVGGSIKIADVKKVWEYLNSNNPSILSELFSEFPNDKRSNKESSNWFMAPIFFSYRESIYCRYIRRFIEDSQEHYDAPRLTSNQKKALDILDSALSLKENHVVIKVEEGDLLLIDNFRALHARDSYVDTSNTSKRLAYRMWVSHADSPGLPDSFLNVFNDIRPGVLRGSFEH